MLEPAPQERQGCAESRAHWLGDGVGGGGSEEQEELRQSPALPPLQQRRDPWGRGWRDRRPHVGALPLRPRHAGLRTDPSRSTDAKDVGRLV